MPEGSIPLLEGWVETVAGLDYGKGGCFIVI